MFPALPVPEHTNDWHAQYYQLPQTMADFGARRIRARPVFVLPLVVLENTGKELQGKALEQALSKGMAELPDMDELVAYMRIYYQMDTIQCLPPLPIHVNRKRKAAFVFGNPIGWRDHCPFNGKSLPAGQVGTREQPTAQCAERRDLIPGLSLCCSPGVAAECE